LSKEEITLTTEQKELLYLIARLTDSINCPTSWIKETPLQALIFHGIRKGLFNEYDYAPISTSFLGQGRKFVNISKEGEDDLGDLRELGLLETIRVSSEKHDYLTGYRPTKESIPILYTISKEIKERVDNLFRCPVCKSQNYNLSINVENSAFAMRCEDCKNIEQIPLIIPEDVSYNTKPYFFSFLIKKVPKEANK